jgi:hypothetical protein
MKIIVTSVKENPFIGFGLEIEENWLRKLMILTKNLIFL